MHFIKSNRDHFSVIAKNCDFDHLKIYSVDQHPNERSEILLFLTASADGLFRRLHTDYLVQIKAKILKSPQKDEFTNQSSDNTSVDRRAIVNNSKIKEIHRRVIRKWKNLPAI